MLNPSQTAITEPTITLPCRTVREAISRMDELAGECASTFPANEELHEFIVDCLYDLRRAVWSAALERFLNCFKEGGDANS